MFLYSFRKACAPPTGPASSTFLIFLLMLRVSPFYLLYYDLRRCFLSYQHYSTLQAKQHNTQNSKAQLFKYDFDMILILVNRHILVGQLKVPLEFPNACRDIQRDIIIAFLCHLLTVLSCPYQILVVISKQTSVANYPLRGLQLQICHPTATVNTVLIMLMFSPFYDDHNQPTWFVS